MYNREMIGRLVTFVSRRDGVTDKRDLSLDVKQKLSLPLKILASKRGYAQYVVK